VAGGANFPGKMPWEGGTKVWWDDIWVLENVAGPRPEWMSGSVFRLPRPLAYGFSVSTPEGVICVGGNDAAHCYPEVFQLAWDPSARTVRTTVLPPLPQPLTNLAGALVGRTLFVAGGQHLVKAGAAVSVFWALDLGLRGRADEFKWRELPTWPGPARVLAVAAAQGAPGQEQFFLFSGRRPQAGGATRLLTDAYAYDPRTGRWRTLANVGGGKGVSVMAGVAAAVGRDEVYVFGGDRGDLFLELEAHDLAIERGRGRWAEADAAVRGAIERDVEQHLAAKREIYARHPGFGREVFAYHVGRDTWRIVERAPGSLPVTTLAAKAGARIVIPSGEILPGVRTPEVIGVTPEKD
jgi:N-acetylneuraminic acid mutarotase